MNITPLPNPLSKYIILAKLAGLAIAVFVVFNAGDRYRDGKWLEKDNARIAEESAAKLESQQLLNDLALADARTAGEEFGRLRAQLAEAKQKADDATKERKQAQQRNWKYASDLKALQKQYADSGGTSCPVAPGVQAHFSKRLNTVRGRRPTKSGLQESRRPTVETLAGAPTSN